MNIKRLPKLFLIVFALLQASQGTAQSISGTIADPEDQPIPFALISQHAPADSTVLSAQFADSLGNFVVSNVTDTAALLHISVTGFQPQWWLAQQNQHPLRINLEPAAGELEEVQITNRRPLYERKTDRTIFNVSASITAEGSTLLDAVKKTPGVVVQQSDNRIQLVGKSGVMVLVNNRLLPLEGGDLIQYLQSQPASSAERIEVITTPPARYDASGNAGLINIVLRKNAQQGWQASVRSSYEQATRGKWLGAADFSLRFPKWNIYANGSFSQAKNNISETLITPYPEQRYEVADHNLRSLLPFNYSVAADYLLHRSGVLGIQWMSNGLHRENLSETSILVSGVRTAQVGSSMLTHTIGNTFQNNHILNLNYQWDIDTSGKKLTINANKLWFSGDRTNDFITRHYQGRWQQSTGLGYYNTTTGMQHIELGAAQADLEIPNAVLPFSAGIKCSFTRNESNNVFGSWENGNYTEDPAISNAFDYTENVQAMYINAHKSLGKWSFQAGMRAEYTQTTGYSRQLQNKHKNGYVSFFPTAYVLFQPQENHSLNLNYGRRIQRPDYRSLDPFRAYATPYHYNQGDPFLQPAFNHNIELNYTYRARYTLTAYYHLQQQYFSSVWFVDEAQKVTSNRSMNFGELTLYGLNFTASIQPWAWWTTLLQGNYAQQRLYSDVYAAAQTYSIGNIYAGTYNTFTLNRKQTIFAELNAYYMSRFRVDFLEMEPVGNIDLGIKALFFDNKLNVALNLSDMLATQRYKGVHIVSGQTINNYFDTRNLRLSLSYKIGNDARRQMRERSTGIEDETRRTG
jgi:hypothetical protein